MLLMTYAEYVHQILSFACGVLGSPKYGLMSSVRRHTLAFSCRDCIFFPFSCLIFQATTLSTIE